MARSWRNQSRLHAKPVSAPCTTQLLKFQHCVICGASKCTITAHRIATLQVLKRSAKNSKKNGSRYPTHSSIRIRPPTVAGQEQPYFVKSPSAAESLIDPFTAFPVPGATKDMMRQFHAFFTQQGGFVTNNHRKLVFDQRGFAGLYPSAMQNPALCMSVVALATSYNAIHFRNRVSPDVECLSVYNQTFELIRAQIDGAQTPHIVECTIGAVHRLAMACGIGFGDADACITHWNGVLALLDKFPYLRSSGHIMGYVTQIEYWVAMNPGVKPRSTEWPVLLVHENPPPKSCGQTFPKLFSLPIMWSDESSKLLSVSLTTCRATEVLEAAVTAAALPSMSSGATAGPGPYFMHLFDVLLRQQAQLYTSLMYRTDVVECVCITLNIYFMIVIRCTPWRAPLEHLCVRLRNSLVIRGSDFKLETSTPLSDVTDSSINEEEIAIMNNLFLWMLVVCACALQLCQNRGCQDWALKSLRAMCQNDISLANESGRAEVLRRIKGFCWSDTFLMKRFEELCIEINLSI